MLARSLALVSLLCACGPMASPPGETDSGTGDEAAMTAEDETDMTGGDGAVVPGAWIGELIVGPEETRFAPCDGPEGVLLGGPTADACLVPLLVHIAGVLDTSEAEPVYTLEAIFEGPCQVGTCDDPTTWRECIDADRPAGVDPLCASPPGCGFACFDLDPASCPGGEKCTLFDCDGGGTLAVCRAAGTASLGDGCVSDPLNGVDSCVTGTICHASRCQALCDPSTMVPCPGPIQVCAEFEAALGICLDECDPMAPACGPLEQCAPLQGTFACTPAP